MNKFKILKTFVFILFLQCIGSQMSFAQLSSVHYLPPLKKSGSSAEFGGQGFYLSTPEVSPFDVNVYQGTNTTPVATISISNTSNGRYDPPLGTGGTVAHGSNNTSFVTDAYAGIVLNTAGFRFESPSGKKFYVNWRAAHTAQAASLVSAGEAALGTDFKWGGSPLVSIATGSFANSSYDINVNSVIGIMATEDNTQVSISGYNPACTFTNASGRNGITADVINLTLNAGQTYVLESRPTGLTSATSPNNDGWLGATISSNKNIAVNQGHLLLSFNVGNLDMSMTQITPTSNIGKEYVFIRGLGGDKPEFPVIIATENNTEVFVNNETTPFATLNEGQWVKIPSSKYSQSGINGGYQGANMYVEASKNVYAFQTLDAGQNNDYPANADVFQVAPLNCLLDNGVNNIPKIIETGNSTYNNLSTIYLMIMASSAINENNISIKYGLGSANTIPSSTLTSARKTVSGTSDWVTYFVQIPTPQGDVSVYAPGPIAVAYLGYSGAVGVAGYFSGFGSIPTISVQTSGNGCFPNTTLTATAGFTSYAWYKDDVLLPSVTTNTYTPTVAGDYHVVVYNGFCTYPSAKTTVYDCNPEVLVTNTASDNYLLPGETTIFTIKVKLLGASAAQNMQLSNVLPAHLTYVSSTVTEGTFTGSGSNYTWNVGTMTNGEENILTLTATAQSVTSAYSETYTVNNTQTFAFGTETNVLVDDFTENVIIYPSCTSSLAGTISGAASYCGAVNSTTLTSNNSVGNLQWQSSLDNSNFSDISGQESTTLQLTNLAASTYFRVKTTVETCVVYSPSIVITVSQGPEYTMTSANGSNAQSICVNSSIVPITYTTTNTTSASFSGLPSGVSGTWVNNVITISGTPSVTGTFSYTVELSGSCSVSITGSMTVTNTNNTISLTSAVGTNSQTIENNSTITNITYTTTGAIGATFSGFPTGVTGVWSNNAITIAGTPTAAGIYNYSVTLNGGCGSVNAVGTLTVKGVVISSSISGSSICSGSSLTFTAATTGFTSPNYQWYKNNTLISGATNATYETTSLINNDVVKVTASEGSTPAITSNSITTIVDPSPSALITTIGDGCINKTTLSTTSGQTSYAWYKDNVAVSGATSNTYTPTIIGEYQVQVSNGTCSAMSATTTISTCGVTSDGSMIIVDNSTTLVSRDGAINSGKGVDERGLIVTKPFYAPAIVTNGLVLYLDAANSSSYPGTGTTWTDLSSSANVGTFVGATSYSSSDAGTILFNGNSSSNDYVSVANNATLNLTTAGSISIWIKPNTLTQLGLTNLISRTINGDVNGQSYYIIWSGGNISGFIQNGGVYKAISAPVPTSIGWYNYVFTWGNGYLNLYQNGISVATPVASSINAQTLSTTVNIGGYVFGGAGGNANTFNGKIPFVTLYNREITPAEVLTNFNAVKTRYGL